MEQSRVAKIPDRIVKNQPMFVTWNDGPSKKIALTTAAQASEGYGQIAQKTTASDIFLNAGGNNTSVRDGMMRRDYDYFRPEEATPRNTRAIIFACQAAYRRIGIIRNIIDLMGEFTCQGIQLIHPNKQIEAFHQEWAKKVNFVERSERFCNHLYRSANILVQRETSIINDNGIQLLKKGLASEHITAVDKMELSPRVRKGEIPTSYTYINPLAVEVLGGEDLAQFVGGAQYALPIPDKIFNKVRNPKTPEEIYLVNQLPDYIISAAKRGVKVIPLDPNKVQSFHYKKDDWQIWADPMIYGIIDDLILYSKMKLADLAALDGAISHIRLWKLGDLQAGIMPTSAAISRLADVLCNNTGVGAIDLIWGPELSLEETSTDVYRFLGAGKYEAVLSSIYDGLGIPSSLRSMSGGKGAKGGMSSFLSLKVMMERLKYGRSILNSFWEPELRIIQKALGLRFPAQLKYDYMLLSDESAFLKLLLDLVDRDLISVETVQEAFGNIPEIEDLRIRREHKKREGGKMVNKAGPYHNPAVEDDLLKIFAQAGTIAPSEAGVDLDEKSPGQKTLQDYKMDQIKATPKPAAIGGSGNSKGRPRPKKPKGQSGQGRPKGKSDSSPRKQRALRPAKAADFFTTQAWAKNVQADISNLVNPVYLSSLGKDSVRKLTDEEARSLEDLRFAILCNLPAHAEFNEQKMQDILSTPLLIPPVVYALMKATVDKFHEKISRLPTLEEQRLLQSEVYALWLEADGVSDDIEEDNDEGKDEPDQMSEV